MGFQNRGWSLRRQGWGWAEQMDASVVKQARHGEWLKTGERGKPRERAYWCPSLRWDLHRTYMEAYKLWVSLDSRRGPASMSTVKAGRQERHWLGVQVCTDLGLWAWGYSWDRRKCIMWEKKIVLESQGYLSDIPTNVCGSSRDGEAQGDWKESSKVTGGKKSRNGIPSGWKESQQDWMPWITTLAVGGANPCQTTVRDTRWKETMRVTPLRKKLGPEVNWLEWKRSFVFFSWENSSIYVYAKEKWSLI